MQAGANSFATMLIGRIVAGFAIGYVLSMFPTLCFLLMNLLEYCR